MSPRSILCAAVLLAAPFATEAKAQGLVAPAQLAFGGGLPSGMGPPWTWVSAGQPVLMSPLWAPVPALAAIAPAPWGLWEAAYQRSRDPARSAFNNVEAYVGAGRPAIAGARSGSMDTLNWSAVAVMNSGDSHGR